jgi:RecA-family ATPase
MESVVYIIEWIKSVQSPRLIIIDTLAMVRAPKGKSQTDYDADYNAVLALRDLAAQHGLAIVVVHHLRKAEADDPFDTISGTLGLTGAPDSVLVLKRDTAGVVLHGKGRDLLDIEKVLTFDRDSCVWTIAGEPRDLRASAEHKAILAAMKEIGGAASPNEIATLAQVKVGTVRHLLLKMAKDGAVHRTDYGRYELQTVNGGRNV